MHLLAIGLNHTTAPVSVRERVAFGPEEIAETIGHMRERFSSTQMGGIHEAAILSTCNRTEIYCAAEDTDAARDSVLGFICERKNVSRSELEPHIYTFTQEEAAKHTFRVASGLDSMVLGETQIVGQMKKAEKMARDAHGLGTMLNHLFQSPSHCRKRSNPLPCRFCRHNGRIRNQSLPGRFSVRLLYARFR